MTILIIEHDAKLFEFAINRIDQWQDFGTSPPENVRKDPESDRGVFGEGITHEYSYELQINNLIEHQRFTRIHGGIQAVSGVDMDGIKVNWSR